MDFPLLSLPAHAVLALWCLPLSCACAGLAWLRRGVPAGWLCLALGGTLVGLYTGTLGLAMLSLWVGSFMFMAHWLQGLWRQREIDQAAGTPDAPGADQR